MHMRISLSSYLPPSLEFAYSSAFQTRKNPAVQKYTLSFPSHTQKKSVAIISFSDSHGHYVYYLFSFRVPL